MSFIQIRLTGASYGDASFNWTRGRLLKEFREKYQPSKYLYTIETKDKYGKDTEPHIHFNCELNEPVKKDTLQAWFRRFSNNAGFPLKGNKCYSIRVLADMEDEDRWWRYCLKEQGSKSFSKGFDKQQLKNWRMLAVDERNRQIEKNNKALDKYLDKSSFKGKMFSFFQEKEISTHKPFVIGLIKYYMEKSQVPPFSKIDDYWIDYKISVGIMSVEEYYEFRYNN